MGSKTRTKNERRQRHITQLERRATFLRDRIAAYREDGNPSYDKAELAAITYALAVIRNLIEAGIVEEFELRV